MLLQNELVQQSSTTILLTITSHIYTPQEFLLMLQLAMMVSNNAHLRMRMDFQLFGRNHGHHY